MDKDNVENQCIHKKKLQDRLIKDYISILYKNYFDEDNKENEDDK